MQKVKLNIVPKGVKRTTYLSQNDNGRVVRYELFNELVPYTLDGSETITLTVVRPDGEEIVSNVPNTEEAYIDVTFNDDMSAIAGVGAGEIKITDGETVLGSHNFDINVEIDAYNGKDVVIETETGTLLSFNTEVEDNALEYESEIPYNSEGYTGLEIVNSRTAPAYDKTPYLFRKTPSGYGNSCKEKIIGASVAFNQLVQNGNFESVSDWDKTRGNISASNNELTYTITEVGSDSAANRIYQTLSDVSGHKLYISCEVLSTKSDNIGVRLSAAGVSYYIPATPNVWTQINCILISGDNDTLWIALGQQSASIGDIVKIRNVNVKDLTAWFGSSTIADYLYNLEQATAGAGISFFKSLGFDNPYYEYNAGSLMSSKPLSKKVVGKNFFNYDLSDAGSTLKYVSIKVGNGTYTMSSNAPLVEGVSILFFLAGYVSSGASTAINGVSNGISRTVTTTDGYVTFAYRYYGNPSVYPDGYNIQIEYGNEATDYQPYSEETYNLGGDELRGLLKLDANNNIFAYGDIKTSDGNIKRKFARIDLASLTWTATLWGTSPVFQATISNIKKPEYYTKPNIISEKYITEFSNASSCDENDITVSYAFETVFVGRSSDNTTITPTGYMDYEIATPAEESSTPFVNPQEVKVTEEFIDERATPIPVGHDTLYGTDIELTDIDFDTTIYGGDIDAINGVLTSRYNSDGSVKTTPDIIDVTPTPIPVRAGDNNIFNSANGNQTIRYYNQVEE